MSSLVLKVRVDLEVDRCKGCELCVQACPRDVLAMGDTINALGYRPSQVVNPERCTGCMACYMVCPDTCFTIERLA